jgi:hypothetical protein
VGVSDKLRKVGDFLRKNWRSTADDSYREYERERERERKQAERGRQDAQRVAERKRGKADREHEYEERYAAQRAAEEPQPEAPRDDTSKPEGPAPFSLGASRPSIPFTPLVEVPSGEVEGGHARFSVSRAAGPLLACTRYATSGLGVPYCSVSPVA